MEFIIIIIQFISSLYILQIYLSFNIYNLHQTITIMTDKIAVSQIQYKREFNRTIY